MQPRAFPISLPEYRALLNHLWSDVPPRLGLAVSGGVDSMALSYLTRRLIEQERTPPKVHAFIIDHGARPESSTEASSVASILKSYGFIAHILPLEWKPNNLFKSGFETRARAARYQALASACVQRGVFRLLLAHHADDQAETVIMRLISGSKLDGLGGMKAVAGIPECWDVYGARKVVVGRPFLMVGKERLKLTCETNAVPWFEDNTNNDGTYTRRNTVRQLLTATPPRLPRALRRDSLLALSQKAETRNHAVKEEALRLLRDHCNINLNTRTGSLRLELPRDRETLWAHVKAPVLQRLLIEVAEMVSPSQRVETRHMLNAFKRVFNAQEDDKLRTFTSAKLAWTYEGKQRWILDREPFTPQKKEQIKSSFGKGWSEWKLWDGRWWIRVETPQGCSSTTVRTLDKADMKVMRALARELKMNHALESALKELRMGLRYTVPAIFWRGKEKGKEEGEERLVALPTMGLNFAKDVKYKAKFKD